MSLYPVHSLDTAPPASRQTLRRVRDSVGLIPNLAAAMAESPSLLQGFFALREVYYKEGTLGPIEIQVLSLTNAFENGCRYCMALHSAMALKDGLSAESVQALRQGRPPLEPRLRALSDLSRALITQRGQLQEGELSAFLEAGFAPAQALEVVLGIAVSTLANYSHHLCEAPVDELFRAHRWEPPSRPAAAASS